jgi:omega-amidase
MKIGLVQYSPCWENREENIICIEELIKKSSKDFDALVFPEMSLTGFTMNTAKYAEEIDSLGMQYFIKIAERLKTNVFAGIIERDGNHVYNSLVHFERLGLIKARYRKIHPYSLGEEDKYFTAGNELVVTDINRTRIGLSICYDLRFPELYRLYAKKGIDIIIDIANWPVSRVEHWKTLIRARAIENQCFMIGVNRVGRDNTSNYNGRSAVFDPMGNQVFLADDEERIIEVEIDLSIVNSTRVKFPFLKDMKLI